VNNGNDDFVTSVRDRFCRPRVKRVAVTIPDTSRGAVTAVHRDPLSQFNKHKVLERCQGDGGLGACVYHAADDGNGWMCDLPSPYRGQTAVAFNKSNSLGTRDDKVFVAAFLTAYLLAHLRIAESVTASGARLATGWAGSPLLWLRRSLAILRLAS